MRKNIYLIGLNSFEIRIVSQALCRSYGACVIHLSITYYDGTPTEHETHLIRNRLRYKNTRFQKMENQIDGN